ncbi:unnamed protein product [Spirodela intermedia]|uniref:Uncharacterized protein n=2 Tax=Spirodela intermedia TaxID=51605 RepID=A0A7I8J598_SPIIN|nr:unnamed protein product [Spirodela intermedia]CAA6665239.1 unnamed protein product [Spirodela intermedia]CAA7401972.1 unnamed protein product [Spirodela intermedia]
MPHHENAMEGPGDAGYLDTFPVLSKANYPLWAMQMQLHLEADSLSEAIESETVRSSRLVSREKKSSFHMVLRKQEEKALETEDIDEVEDAIEAEEEAMTEVLMRTRNLETNIR